MAQKIRDVKVRGVECDERVILSQYDKGTAKIANGLMKIEVLYIQDCPGYRPTWYAIEKILAEDHIKATVIGIKVTDPNTPGFRGSPTVRINGNDIEHGLHVLACGLTCRTYVSNGKFQNAPSHEKLRAAIKRVECPGTQI